MATYSQLPGRLNIAIRKADRFATVVDFDISLTGFTVSSEVISTLSGDIVVPISVDTTLASEGKVGLSLTSAQTAGLASGTYLWRLAWNPGDAPRTALQGFFEVTP
jgi:hypothetical protein